MGALTCLGSDYLGFPERPGDLLSSLETLQRNEEIIGKFRCSLEPFSHF